MAHGEELLYSVGFRERMLLEPSKEVYYVLEEPDPEKELEAWVEWFEQLRRTSAMFKRIASALK